MKIPLILTMGRLIISPIFLLIYLYYKSMGIGLTVMPWILLGLLILSEISDFLDGFIARKYGYVTDLGKILDPMSDSIVKLCVLLTFTQGLIQLPLLILFVFIYREIMIGTLRTICALRGVALAARKSGKVKTALQAAVIFAVIILMLPYSWGWISLKMLQIWSWSLIGFVALYTAFSGTEYIVSNWRYIKEVWIHKRD